MPLFRSLALAIGFGVCLVGAQTAAPIKPDDGPWPPAGVHRPGEPGLSNPRLVTEVKPQYTEAAIHAKLSGRVGLQCVIEADGSIGAIRVVESLDRTTGLDDQAVAAAKQWRFAPGLLNGVPVRVVVTLNLTFSLRDGPPAVASTPIPSFAWPLAFQPKDNAAPASSAWAEDVEEAEGLQFRIAYPQGWTILVKKLPNQLVSITSGDGRAVFGIATPTPGAREISQPLPQAALDALANALRIRLSGKAAAAQLSAVGQVQPPGRLWIWVETPITFDQSSLPLELAAAVGLGPFDGAVMWNFSTTSAGRMVSVVCSALRDRTESDADFQKEMREVGVIFSQMLQRIVIQTR